MHFPLKTTLVIIAAGCLASPLIVSSDVFLGDQSFQQAKVDADEARELKQSGQIMSLETLIAKVRQDYPGQIIKIELDDRDDRYVYEIEIVDDAGIVIDLRIDAATGEVLRYRKDD
jgi:uncharacterized membrane protein YkoI